MQALNAFLGSWAGQAGLVALLVWSVGLFRRSAAYGRLRQAWGRLCESAGAALSILGRNRLGAPLWEPLEAVLADFLLFGAERLAVGLRKDDAGKMLAHVQRLAAVGSQTTATAIATKVAAMDPQAIRSLEPRTPQEARILARALDMRSTTLQRALED